MSKPSVSITYLYDHNGLRTSKAVTENNTTITTNYIYNGNLLVHMTKDSDSMHFFYDAQGRPAMVDYNGTKYTYLHNLQGDVIGLVDAQGNLVVEYKYNAWGFILDRTGSLVTTLGYLNPFRYRGYVYDEETGLYYCRSRYYRAEWERWISADGLLGKAGGLLSHNLFVYCRNNPIIRCDHSGNHDWSDDGADCCGGIIFSFGRNPYTVTTTPQVIEDVSSTYSSWLAMQTYEEWFINSQYNGFVVLDENYLTIQNITTKLQISAKQVSANITGTGPYVGIQNILLLHALSMTLIFLGSEQKYHTYLCLKYLMQLKVL